MSTGTMETGGRGMLDRLVDGLSAVPGVAAVVLGGSRAQGTGHEGSDHDIGIYYRPDRPLDIAALNEVARRLDDRHPEQAVTPPGAWGKWIDGGGWLVVDGRPVDLLYRDLGRVGTVIDECRAGRYRIDYQSGHPHGFLSTIYMAEIACCRPLWDPGGTIRALKERTTPYPPALAQALIRDFSWEAAFAAATGRKGIARGDAAYAAGACFRSVACLMQVLFAVNGRYLMNEKGAVAIAGGLPKRPDRLERRVDEVFTVIAADPAPLSVAFDRLDALVREVVAIAATADS